ncbi:MAG: hypothetical protein JWQ22_2541 [Devosia sp.]|nr:hypothetical protein [Devosia sp.]
MKVQEDRRAITKRDLINKLHKVEKALGAQAQRADVAERANNSLIAEMLQLRMRVVPAH